MRQTQRDSRVFPVTLPQFRARKMGTKKKNWRQTIARHTTSQRKGSTTAGKLHRRHSTIHLQGESDSNAMSILREIIPGRYSHPQINTHVHHTHKFPPWNVDRGCATPTPPQHQPYRTGRHAEGHREAESRPATDHKITTCKARPHHPHSITLLHAHRVRLHRSPTIRHECSLRALEKVQRQ